MSVNPHPVRMAGFAPTWYHLTRVSVELASREVTAKRT